MSTMFTHQSDKTHEEVDLESIIRYYDSIGMEQLSPREGLAGQFVTGPYHLYCNELIRRKYDMKSGEVVPTDLFLFSEGEAPRREVTKLGGVPYWPASEPWPTTPDGEPFYFVAQFCFTDSKDLVDDLPGDILLILFADDDWCGQIGATESIRFEWQTICDRELIGTSPNIGIEKPFWASVGQGAKDCCYGSLLRYASYPEAMEEIQQAGRLDLHDVYNDYLAPMPHGTRIGGLPHFSEELWDDLKDFPGRFLCQLAYIGGDSGVPYPWLNRESPLSIDESSTLFAVGDVGSLYMYLQDDGSVWSFQTPG